MIFIYCWVKVTGEIPCLTYRVLVVEGRPVVGPERRGCSCLMLLEREGQEGSGWRPGWAGSNLDLTSTNPALREAEAATRATCKEEKG